MTRFSLSLPRHCITNSVRFSLRKIVVFNSVVHRYYIRLYISILFFFIFIFLARIEQCLLLLLLSYGCFWLLLLCAVVDLNRFIYNVRFTLRIFFLMKMLFDSVNSVKTHWTSRMGRKLSLQQISCWFYVKMACGKLLLIILWVFSLIVMKNEFYAGWQFFFSIFAPLRYKEIL